jgi:transposase
MNKTISIGIDVSKAKLDICLLKESGSRNLQIANNLKGMNSLKQKLQEIDSIPIVIEATGGYHYDITFFLLDNLYLLL